VDALRIGANTPPELTGIYGLASRKAFYLGNLRWPAAQLTPLAPKVIPYYLPYKSMAFFSL